MSKKKFKTNYIKSVVDRDKHHVTLISDGRDIVLGGLESFAAGMEDKSRQEALEFLMNHVKRYERDWTYLLVAHNDSSTDPIGYTSIINTITDTYKADLLEMLKDMAEVAAIEKGGKLTKYSFVISPGVRDVNTVHVSFLGALMQQGLLESV